MIVARMRGELNMSWIWHRFNLDKEKREGQCWNDYHCLVCYFKLLLDSAWWKIKYRRE
jgi:hypothetical protein